MKYEVEDCMRGGEEEGRKSDNEGKEEEGEAESVHKRKAQVECVCAWGKF